MNKQDSYKTFDEIQQILKTLCCKYKEEAGTLQELATKINYFALTMMGENGHHNAVDSSKEI